MKRDRRAWRRKAPAYKALIKYIFPGGEVDHIGMTLENLEAYGFEVHDVEDLREHYARTCRSGRSGCTPASTRRSPRSAKPRRGYGCFTSTGCSLGFDGGSVTDLPDGGDQTGAGASGLPPTRADLYR